MAIERIHAIHRSPISLFDSHWDADVLDEFGHSLKSMERRMRDMDRQFEQMCGQFLRLTPTTESRFRFKDDWGKGLLMDDLDSPLALPSAGSLMRRQDSYDVGFPDADVKDRVVTEKDGKRFLRLQYDVRQFKPDNIEVKTIDNKLEVHAKREVGEGDEKVYREYHRITSLPEDLEPDILNATFSPEGVLRIEAPLPDLKPAIEPKAASEVITSPVKIPIQHQKSVPSESSK